MKADRSLSIPFPYQPGHFFVDREGELNRVLDKVQALLRREPVRNRTTAYYGPRGSGKSWLLRELHHRLRNSEEFRDRVVSLFIALGPSLAGTPQDGFHIPANERAQKWPILSVADLLEGVANRLRVEGASRSPALDHLVRQLIEEWRKQRRPVVVIVDGIDEMPPEFLRELENHFLAPLALEPYVLIVLGGRVRDPRKYTWKMPELKLYADEVWLTPFNEHWTREQLACLSPLGFSPAAAPEVLKAGNGYPLSNVALAEYLEGDPPRWKDKGTALKRCADLLLENVDPDLREYFRALCVLRSFDEDRMMPILAAWFGTDAPWTYHSCRRIREDMVATRLVRWDGTRGFVMDEALRAVLENALRENDPDRWRALHRAAYNLFTDWVARYPTARERWLPEAEYHRQFIGEA